MKKLLLVFISISCFGQTPSIEWSKTFGGSQRDVADKIKQTTDGGYILAGNTYSNDGDITSNHGQSDILVIKLDAAGGIIWKKTYGGSGDDFAGDIQQTADGGYIICGDTNSTDGDITQNDGLTKIWLIKLSATGSIEWQTTFGPNLHLISGSRRFVQTTDGNFVIAASSYYVDVFGGGYSPTDIYIAKLSQNGGLIWEKYYGGTGEEYPASIYETSDSGFIVGSVSNSDDVDGHHGANFSKDYYILKLDNEGNLQWQKSLGGFGDESGGYVKQTIDGGYITSGFTYYSAANQGDVTGNHGGYDTWVVKLNSSGNIEWQKCIGTALDEYLTREIYQYPDGSYLVAGTRGTFTTTNGVYFDNDTTADIVITKIDATGTVLWEKLIGGSLGDFSEDSQITSDGGSIIVGHTFSNNIDGNSNHGGSDIWVVKLSESLSNNTFSQNNSLITYPNPTTNQLNIKVADNTIIDKIIITDLSGKAILVQSENINQINTENLSTGMYFIQAFSGQNKYQTKFIKE